jgi:alpha-L-fucosidase
MLGVAPDNRGLLPDSDVRRLEELGAALRKRAENNLVLHRDQANVGFEAALDGDPDTFWSAPSGSRHAEVEVDFVKPMAFDHAVTMEWQNDGQHIQKYALEIWSESDKAWKRIAEGQAIGHKKIDRFPSVTAQRVRLNILSSTSEAHIREFQLYDWSR